jgi:hypothetical protein
MKHPQVVLLVLPARLLCLRVAHPQVVLLADLLVLQAVAYLLCQAVAVLPVWAVLPAWAVLRWAGHPCKVSRS